MNNKILQEEEVQLKKRKKSNRMKFLAIGAGFSAGLFMFMRRALKPEFYANFYDVTGKEVPEEEREAPIDEKKE